MLDIDELYREHGAFVGRCLERLVGAGPHVDDLLQDTFLAAFRRQRSFDPSRASATTWLYGILRNVARDYGRSTRRRRAFHERLEVQPSAVAVLPDAAVERGQALRLVTDTLRRLPMKQREVFALYELEGLDGPDIAALIGVPLGTVWTRLHHARHAFAQSLERHLAKERRHEA